MRTLRILPPVLGDVAEAANWYDTEGHPGLGDRFVACFYAYLPKIQESGETYRMVYRDFCKVVIKPFPYIVYFRRNQEEWIVTLVIHAARRPELARTLLNSRR